MGCVSVWYYVCMQNIFYGLGYAAGGAFLLGFGIRFRKRFNELSRLSAGATDVVDAEVVDVSDSSMSGGKLALVAEYSFMDRSSRSHKNKLHLMVHQGETSLGKGQRIKVRYLLENPAVNAPEEMVARELQQTKVNSSAFFLAAGIIFVVAIFSFFGK